LYTTLTAEFEERYEYPVVLKQYSSSGETGMLSVLLDQEELNKLQDVGSLIRTFDLPKVS